MPPVGEDEYREVAWGIPKHGDKVQPMWINRHKVRDGDVKFEIKYCGICHSDVHIADGEFPNCYFPCVPGHEIAGVVVEVGKDVKNIEVGDHVGVGCYVDSCQSCEACEVYEENYCEN
jgi:D-arabinose 1-dehydrogenase-like Zn-dependent alcohol dehydrogenase